MLATRSWSTAAAVFVVVLCGMASCDDEGESAVGAGVGSAALLQRDLVRVFRCGDFDTVDIVAPKGKTLKIIRATYGGNNPNRSVTSKVAALVEDNALYMTGGIHNNIGDPEPGIPKTLVIYYQFVSQRTRTYNFHCADFEPVHISAPPAYYLTIVDATYGGRNPNRDVTRQIQALVENNEIHVLGGIHTRIGDPEPGVPKQLNINYQFTPFECSLCSGVLEFRCGDFQPVHIQAPTDTSLQVIHATYGGNQPNRDVTDKIAALIVDESIDVDGGIHTRIGDPEPGVPKTLVIQYRFTLPTSKVASWSDFDTVDIVAPPGYSLRIVHATYGGLNPSRDVTAKVAGLVRSNSIHMEGGIHLYIGDPEPNIPKKFVVRYSFDPL
ncbi:hypothetical protein Pelo_15849 [Pelomyxa schiedti]|nr:hypothetical protein Pelo_15849 [Pelomyxa schiedti]